MNKVPSILAGLEYVRDGVPVDEIIEHPQAQTPFEQAALEQLRALGEMVVQLSRDNELLKGQVKQLEAPREDRNAETSRMNQYLLGELERHRFETEQNSKHRPWWQFWGRR